MRLCVGSRTRLSGRPGAYEASLGRARLISQHPGANHVTDFHVGLRRIRQARPSVPPNRVHLYSGLLFGSRPSPDASRRTTSFAYGSARSHGCSRRDSNPLDTCAARRTGNVCLRRRITGTLGFLVLCLQRPYVSDHSTSTPIAPIAPIWINRRRCTLYAQPHRRPLRKKAQRPECS